MTEQFTCSRSAADAFDYITDFSRIQEWDHTIKSSKKTSPGTIGVGTQFEVIYSMGLKNIPINYEIIEFQPSNKAILRGEASNFIATDTVTIKEENGTCHVDWQAEIEFSGAAAKVMPLIKNKVLKAGKQTIKDLAIALKDDYQAPALSSFKALADKLVFPGLAGFTKLGYTVGTRSWNPVTNSVKGKHMVISGATSGLGLASAYELAHRGASLTLVARNARKAEVVAKEITAATGNSHIAIEIADMSEVSQVVELSERLLKTKRPIDVLINNAGALLNPRRENSEGLEASFALLLLGPVILTEKLKPLLGKAASPESPARVINVSSGGMYAKRISTTNLESSKGEYSGADAYARSKRGLVMSAEYWAESWKDDNIVVQSMHPGWAKTPGVEDSLPEFNKIMQHVLRSAEQGADTIIWLACASEAVKSSGLFWLDREPHTTHLSNKTRENSQQRQALFDALREYALRYDVTLEVGT